MFRTFFKVWKFMEAIVFYIELLNTFYCFNFKGLHFGISQIRKWYLMNSTLKRVAHMEYKEFNSLRSLKSAALIWDMAFIAAMQLFFIIFINERDVL